MRVLLREIESYGISVFKLVEAVDADCDATSSRGHAVQVGDVSQTLDDLDLDDSLALTPAASPQYARAGFPR